jgi:hypothetical protein
MDAWIHSKLPPPPYRLGGHGQTKMSYILLLQHIEYI